MVQHECRKIICVTQRRLGIWARWRMVWCPAGTAIGRGQAVGL